MSGIEARISAVYEAFNARDIDRVLHTYAFRDGLIERMEVSDG